MKKMTKKQKNISKNIETDSAYLLKIIMYIIFGALWIRFAAPLHIGPFILNGIPIGLLIGLIFASHDHFQVDRKIEYVVLIVVAIVSNFLPTGIVL